MLLVGARIVDRLIRNARYSLRVLLTTMIGATAVLAAVAGLAAFIPAWRAARVDPRVTLRCD
jgi:ABC-type lipoprotein release transport system permease subunit